MSQEKEELKKYYNFNLPMLQLMAVLAVAGIVITAVIYFWF